jgi:hypothetical protein
MAFAKIATTSFSGLCSCTERCFVEYCLDYRPVAAE